MTYSPQDKKEMTLVQMRNSIGMSRGNALAKAVDLVIALEGIKTEEEMLNKIYEIADKFHHFNQVSIEKDFAEWKSLNEERLNTELGIQPDFEKNIIQEGVKL